MAAITLTKNIRINAACANIDELYGPYESIEEAISTVKEKYRAVGRTVGIIEDGTIVEYQWKTGINDEDLIQKVEKLNLNISIVDEDEYTVEEGENIQVKFMVTGKLGVKKTLLYRMIGNNELFIQEYTGIGKDTINSIIIPDPGAPGIYKYRIKVLDVSDVYAKNGEDEYVEYTIKYGGLSTTYNFTQLNSIQIKNSYSVAEKYFTLNISVRDQEHFNISGVYLSCQDSSILDVNLPPYNTNILNDDYISDTYIGNKFYFLPNSDTLQGFNGKDCIIIVKYTEDGIPRQKIQNLFTLLNIDSLELVPEGDSMTYYSTLPSYYTFKLLSGVENLSVVLKEGEGSDFGFDTVTVNSYKRYSLRIIPKDEKDDAQIVINYTFLYDNVEYRGQFTRVIGNIQELPQQSYYEPQSGDSIDLEKIIDANEDDYTGIVDGKYYKIIQNPVQFNCLSSSFILDFYCRINQQNDNSKKFLTIKYGTREIAHITEDEISCSNLNRSLTTDTPLNEWIQIGIGINLKETFTRNNEEIEGYYHAIYIDGMIVKNVRIETAADILAYNPNSSLTVTIDNNILVQKCFLYYNITEANYIYPNTTLKKPIIYNNFLSHKNFEEPDDLPVLKLVRLNGTEKEQYFHKINRYKNEIGGDLIRYTTTFGTIGSPKATDNIANYDPSYNGNLDPLTDSYPIESSATLFRQSVDVKKPAQKEYAVLCRAQWMKNDQNLLENIIVEVHTQGTSTLVYSVPNFKFTFWQLDGQDNVSPFYPTFIQKDNTEEYYHEYIYTAKADYMDSSHLNNTPTCIYYNNLIKNLIDQEEIIGSPSARTGNLDAIKGFPIVMEISDSGEDEQGNQKEFNEVNFINIGSFMLNIDKTGESLGFEIIENNQKLSCISFEGTSNDNNSGASGRFDIPEGTVLKNYIKLSIDSSYDPSEVDPTIAENIDTYDENSIVDGMRVIDLPYVIIGIDEEEIKADASQINKAIKNSGKALDPESILDGAKVKDHPYVKWCVFLSSGLEYRYPDSDIYKTNSNNTIKKVMDVTHFITIYRMWSWVNISDKLSINKYKSGFSEHFDKDYCILYFIQLMIFAQTDNLGKNAMFDCWGTVNGEECDFSGAKWYPRPYDLDSEAGLDNNGNDNIATFVEIKPEFSLNYDSNYTQEELEENYLLENSQIDYNGKLYDRYHFSSNNSKLWITFYKNYKSEIEGFYRKLRNVANYSAESITELCKSILIDKLGVAQYNQDFINKYLANSDQRLAYGNRWNKFKKWITRRFAFCDSYFGASDSANYSTTSQFVYNIKVDSPQYVSQIYQDDRRTKFVLNNVSFSAGSGAATKITLAVNQGSVLETSLFKYVSRDIGAAKYTNLLKLDVSGNKNQGLSNINSLVGNELNNLRELNISNSGITTLTVPPNIKKLVAENVTLNSLEFPTGCIIEEISLKNSTINDEVKFEQLPNLISLDLSECRFKHNIVFSELPKISSFITTGTIFDGEVIISNNVKIKKFDFTDLNINSLTFSGNDLNIDSLICVRTKFTNDTLNLNAISKNIKQLDFYNCRGLKHLQLTENNKFQNLDALRLDGSYIESLGSNNDKFDCSCFEDINSIYKTVSYRSDGTIGSKTDFTFSNTVIKEIINLDWSGSGANLFSNCKNLINIGGSLDLKYSISSIFYRCYALTTIPTVTIDITEPEYDASGNCLTTTVDNASNAFAGVYRLGYNYIRNIVKKCKKTRNFNDVFHCTCFNNNNKQTIDLDDLFGENDKINSLHHAFDNYINGNFNDKSHVNYVEIDNKLEIIGRIPSTVTNTAGMFCFIPDLTINYDILSGATELKTVYYMFAYVRNIKFIDGQYLTTPIKVDKYGETIKLTNALDQYFFEDNSSIEDMRLMFLNVNVIVFQDIFTHLAGLKNCSSAFQQPITKYQFINSQNESEDLDLDITRAWANNTLLENVSGCFTNIYNVYCEGLEFANPNKKINISGLFGIHSENPNITVRSNSKIIYINIDDISNELVTDNIYPISSVDNYSGAGTFQNRIVVLNSALNTRTSLLSKLSGPCKRLFKHSIVFIPNNIIEFNLNNITDASELFNGTRLYNLNNELIQDISHRKFINITLPTSCAIYTKMFKNSSVLNNLPALRATNASNLSEMYSGCIINRESVILPCDYFAICSESLTNISSMFAYNKYITGLEYQENIGLLENCTGLNNVESMFMDARYLHGGIPKNFFGETEIRYITSLAHMFEKTCILYDIEDINHCINSNTISPLKNLSTIESMFANIRTHSASNPWAGTSYTHDDPYALSNSVIQGPDGTDVYTINPTTFREKNISNINKLFKGSAVNIPFSFKGFETGIEAFLDNYVSEIGSEFVENSSMVRNTDSMFYQTVEYSPQKTRPNKSISNLPAFIVSIKNNTNVSMRYMAGNIIDENIETVYKERNSNESTAYYGNSFFTFLNLTLETDEVAESGWTTNVWLSSGYGRHIYN